MRMSEAVTGVLAGGMTPFAGHSGAGIRIAIVDSGVHPDHPHIRADRLEAGISIAADGTIEHGDEAALDRLGHGTAVTAAIQEKACEAICLPIRVFRERLATSAMALVTAIQWAIAQQADIINLSLGTVNAAHRGIFAQAAASAAEAGVLIIAAREANGQPCYPGALPQVLGVGLDWECPRTGYRLEQGIFMASGYPRPIPGYQQQRNLHGISFAVAQMSAFAALAAEQARGDRVPQRLSAIRHALLAEGVPKQS